MVQSKAETYVSTFESHLEASSQEKHDMKINQDAQAMSMIMKQLTDVYMHPVTSAVRETVSNAIDATRRSVRDSWCEIPPVVIDVREASGRDFVVAVTDRGVGMTKNELLENFANYGNSTKAYDLEQVGSKGLGAKAPLAMTNMMTVVSTKDGVTTTMSLTKERSGFHAYIISEEETGDNSGTTVSFEVSRRNIKECVYVITRYTVMSFDVPIVVTGGVVVISDAVKNKFHYLNVGTVPVSRDENMQLWVNLNGNFFNGYNYCIGGFPYSPEKTFDYMNDHHFNKAVTMVKTDDDALAFCVNHDMFNLPFILCEITPGAVNFTTSRESISSDDAFFQMNSDVIETLFDISYKKSSVTKTPSVFVFARIVNTIAHIYGTDSSVVVKFYHIMHEIFSWTYGTNGLVGQERYHKTYTKCDTDGKKLLGTFLSMVSKGYLGAFYAEVFDGKTVVSSGVLHNHVRFGTYNDIDSVQRDMGSLTVQLMTQHDVDDVYPFFVGTKQAEISIASKSLKKTAQYITVVVSGDISSAVWKKIVSSRTTFCQQYARDNTSSKRVVFRILVSHPDNPLTRDDVDFLVAGNDGYPHTVVELTCNEFLTIARQGAQYKKNAPQEKKKVVDTIPVSRTARLSDKEFVFRMVDGVSRGKNTIGVEELADAKNTVFISDSGFHNGYVLKETLDNYHNTVCGGSVYCVSARNLRAPHVALLQKATAHVVYHSEDSSYTELPSCSKTLKAFLGDVVFDAATSYSKVTSDTEEKVVKFVSGYLNTAYTPRRNKVFAVKHSDFSRYRKDEVADIVESLYPFLRYKSTVLGYTLGNDYSGVCDAYTACAMAVADYPDVRRVALEATEVGNGTAQKMMDMFYDALNVT